MRFILERFSYLWGSDFFLLDYVQLHLLFSLNGNGRYIPAYDERSLDLVCSPFGY